MLGVLEEGEHAPCGHTGSRPVSPHLSSATGGKTREGEVCMSGGGYAPSDRPSKGDGRHIPSGRRRVSDELDACVV